MKREEIQKKALEIGLHYKRAGLAISMGVGKTRIAIQHLQRCYNPFIKALVVIPKLSVADAWKDELEKIDLLSLESHLTFTNLFIIKQTQPS